MTLDEFRGLFNQTTGQGNDAYCMALFIQANLETNHFKSNIYNTCKNLFGMRPAKVREKFYEDVYQTANGEFALYSSRLHSVIDRVDLDTFNGVQPPVDGDDIVRYWQDVQKKGYAIESDYVLRLVDRAKLIASSPLGSSNAFGDTSGDLMDDTDRYEEEGGSFFSRYKWYIIGIVVAVALYFYSRNKIKSNF